jgi:hypothetical protein
MPAPGGMGGPAMIEVNNSGRQVGVELARRLGLNLTKQEGHDLAGACIACQSGDAFRLHMQTGVAHCFSCGGKWSPFRLAETVTRDRDNAQGLMVELGIFKANGHAPNSQLSTADSIQEIARQKGIPADALIAFGAKQIDRHRIELPAYDPKGEQCTTFTLTSKGGKGRFSKGKKAGLFFPHVDGRVRLPKPGEIWHLVEGCKDAAALHAMDLLACGLNTCRLAAKFARLFAGVEIILVPDRDRAGEEGSKFTVRVLRGVAQSVRIAVLPAEFRDSDGEDVRDVLKRPGGCELVLQAIADAQPLKPESGTGVSTDERPEVEVTPDEHKTNDSAIAALIRDEKLFQRGGALVQILRDHGPKTLKGISRPSNAPRIAIVKEATLRERLTAAARFVQRHESDDGEKLIHVHPPKFCISAVAARGHWPEVRHLEGVISSPILRMDGTILQQPGYDSTTGLYYEPGGVPITVSAEPTRDDAVAAAKTVLEVVADFPFTSDAHRAAWLAFVMTPLARHAFEGPSPLFLVDANIRASGKSLLTDAAALIVTGRNMPRMSCPQDDDEARKRITAITLGGDQMILIDNIAGELRSASLDAALTGTVWKDRILGRSEIVEMPLVTTWAATGNNVILGGDAPRRVCHIRLDSKLENPEQRNDFRHPALLTWVRQERPRLLEAALTILAAFCRAGRPDQRLKPWGSFDGWSALLRQGVVWVGLPDPGETREELARSSDREASGLRALLEGWPEIDGDGAGLTASKLIDLLEKNSESFDLVRGAITELCPSQFGKFPGARSVGNKLRHLCGRVIRGKALAKRDHHGTAVWFVANVVQRDAIQRDSSFEGCSGGSSCSSTGDDAFLPAEVADDADLLEELPNQREPAESPAPRCTPTCDSQHWVEESSVDGRSRTTCGKCGRFIGYRSEQVA